jgi:hypothetical protein
MSNFSHLFEDSDKSESLLVETAASNSNNDTYRIDLKLLKPTETQYKARVRFVSNITREGKYGANAIQHKRHYVDISEPAGLKGYFDSPKNFGADQVCPLGSLYFNLKNSNNALQVEKSTLIKYESKYFSYVLVLEDEHRPDLVGKILPFRYGKTIYDKMIELKKGEVNEPGEVFSWTAGNDFVILAQEKSGFINYDASQFVIQKSTFPIFNEDCTKKMNLKLNDAGKLDSKSQEVLMAFLGRREHFIEDCGPKPLTEQQLAKINDITAYLTGRSVTTTTSSFSNAPSTEDIDVLFTAPTPATTSKAAADDDGEDFFS